MVTLYEIIGNHNKRGTMSENKSVLKASRNERQYELHVHNDSPLGEIFDVLCDMKTYIVGRIQEVHTKQEEQRAKEKEIKVDTLEAAPEISEEQIV